MILTISKNTTKTGHEAYYLEVAILGITYRSATSLSATGTTAASATATSGSSASRAFGTLLAVGRCLGLLTSSVGGSAGKLDRDFSLENLLSGQLGDGTLGFGRGGEVDEGVANGTVSARVLGNRDGFAVQRYSQVSRGSTETWHEEWTGCARSEMIGGAVHLEHFADFHSAGLPPLGSRCYPERRRGLRGGQ